MALGLEALAERVTALEAEASEDGAQRLEMRVELLEIRGELHRVGADVHRVIDALTPIQLSLERIASLTEAAAKRADLAQRNAAAIAAHVQAHCQCPARNATEASDGQR